MNVNFPELFVLLLLALLIFGPNKLPEIARNLGKAVRAFQQESSRAVAELRAATEDSGVIDRPGPAPAGEDPAVKPEAPDPSDEDT